MSGGDDPRIVLEGVPGRRSFLRAVWAISLRQPFLLIALVAGPAFIAHGVVKGMVSSYVLGVLCITWIYVWGLTVVPLRRLAMLDPATHSALDADGITSEPGGHLAWGDIASVRFIGDVVVILAQGTGGLFLPAETLDAEARAIIRKWWRDGRLAASQARRK